MEVHYFQFSMRALFISVTLLAVTCWWVVKEKQFVEDRRPILTHIEKVYQGYWNFSHAPLEARASVSVLRRLLGDQAVGMIEISVAADTDKYPVIHHQFSEAELNFFGPMPAVVPALPAK